jgi:hypothetical protein
VALLIAFVSARAEASEEPRYTMLALRWQGASASYRVDALGLRDLTVTSFNQLAPSLELVTYGVDWFMKLEVGDLALFAPAGGGSILARYSASFVGGGEIGVHFATIPFGILAVGLKAGAARIGVRDRDGSGAWIAGGTGADAGVVVHYAFPCFGFLRFDPSVSGGGGVLNGGGPTFVGVWSRAELEVMIEVSSWLAVQVSGGVDVRGYGLQRFDPADPRSFEGVILRGGAGLAFLAPR